MCMCLSVHSRRGHFSADLCSTVLPPVVFAALSIRINYITVCMHACASEYRLHVNVYVFECT